MKTFKVFTGSLFLFFLISASSGIAQTKNAATDKQRQENLAKIQAKQNKQRDSYNKMSEEQKAVARKKSLERKTGKNTGTKPVVNTNAESANRKVNTSTNNAAVDAKPINIPKGPKPTPKWKSPKDAATTKAASKNTTSNAISAKPALNSNAAEKSSVSTKPAIRKLGKPTKSATPASKSNSTGKDKK
jgi:hypothetical protein